MVAHLRDRAHESSHARRQVRPIMAGVRPSDVLVTLYIRPSQRTSIPSASKRDRAIFPETYRRRSQEIGASDSVCSSRVCSAVEVHRLSEGCRVWVREVS